MSTELATQTLQGVSDVAGAMIRLRGLQEAVSAIMVKGLDYGVIPGTDKPTLFKPGAEKLVEFYGLIATINVDEQQEDWERGFWHYRVTCTLTNRRTGEVLANGLGSCNSMESRYRWRVEWQNNPRNQPPIGEGWQWTNTRKGGAWKRRTENEDRWDLPNTILKMAKKRAYVDATLSVTRSSGMFAQDLEDFAHEEPEPVTAPQPAPKPPQADHRQPIEDNRPSPAPSSNPRALSHEEGQRLKAKVAELGHGMGYLPAQAEVWARKWAERVGKRSVIELNTDEARQLVADAAGADMSGEQPPVEGESNV